MKFWDWLRNLAKSNPQGDRIYIPAKQAGVVVTSDTALALSAVHASIRIISETLASLPWQIFRRAAAGREALPGHPIQWLLNTQANPEMTAFIFRRLIVGHMLAWGNGYAEIERGNDGRAIWLWPIPPDCVIVDRDQNKVLRYRVKVSGTDEYLLDRSNILHLADAGYDGIIGQSRIALARRAIGTGIAQDKFAASYYANGASIGGIIENKGKTLSPEARKVLLDEFNVRYAGPDRSHKTLYLDGGMEYKVVQLPLTDAQFLESRKFTIEEIARWYGVPPHLLQDLSQANYATSYEASKNFVEHTLQPLCVLQEQESNMQLFGGRARGDIYSRINLRGLLRGDSKTRAEYYRTMISAGVMSINEVRELEEMNSIGEYGDEHYLQVNMTTIERIAEPEENGEEDGQEETGTEAEVLMQPETPADRTIQ